MGVDLPTFDLSELPANIGDTEDIQRQNDQAQKHLADCGEPRQHLKVMHLGDNS